METFLARLSYEKRNLLDGLPSNLLVGRYLEGEPEKALYQMSRDISVSSISKPLPLKLVLVAYEN